MAFESRPVCNDLGQSVGHFTPTGPYGDGEIINDFGRVVGHVSSDGLVTDDHGSVTGGLRNFVLPRTPFEPIQLTRSLPGRND